MIKIKLYELDIHRNECAFRPYLWAQEILKEIGIIQKDGLILKTLINIDGDLYIKNY